MYLVLMDSNDGRGTSSFQKYILFTYIEVLKKWEQKMKILVLVRCQKNDLISSLTELKPYFSSLNHPRHENKNE